MKFVSIEKTVEIPEKVTVTLEQTRNGQKAKIEGPKGILTREFKRINVLISKHDNQLKIQSSFGRKTEAAMVGTIAGHLKNMIKGVTEGFVYKVRIITSHFPATVEIKKDTIYVNNLYGRRDPIKVPRDKNVEIKIKGDMITFSGIDIERVSQSAARLAEATRLRGKRSKDPTVFQDGLYVVYP
ncbi:MAG: 50S ribosomal protein L6 [Candidatus Hodarchaeales archaeon]